MKLFTWNVQWCLGVDGRVDPKRIVDEARAFASRSSRSVAPRAEPR